MEPTKGEPKRMERQIIYGRTGEIGKDGLLTPDQQEQLNKIQAKAAAHLTAYFDNKEADDPLFPMAAMATGIGKGNIIHRVIEQQVKTKPDSKILIIAGTKLVLVKQTHEALSGYQKQTQQDAFDYVESEEDDKLIDETTSTENNPLEDQKSFLYRTGRLGQKDTNVHVATIQSVQSAISRNNLNPDDYDLVIVDEVHNIGTPNRKAVIDQFKRAIGFTATPYRYSGSLKAPEQYGFGVIESLTLPEAQELGLLPPLLGIQIDTSDVIDEIPTKKDGEINFPALERLLKNSPDLRPYIADKIANIISEEDRRYKTVIVVNFVWEAQELAKLLHEKGIKVGIAINQQAAKEIDTEEIPTIESIERYKLPENDEKSIQVLISPYVASEGFDAPATEVLVWASPTDSSLRYTQYTGRLARRAEGKLFGVVVDCLYQTNQYNWSYNMGMWMKGDVIQLDNGMLWLGPETSIESLKTLPQVEAIRKQADIKPISDLQKEALLSAPEGWMNKSQLLEHLRITKSAILNQLIGIYIESHPEWINMYSVFGKKTAAYYSPDLIKLATEEFSKLHTPHEGWETHDFLVEKILHRALTRDEVNKYSESHPEWLRRLADKRGKVRTFYSPELIEMIKIEFPPLPIAPEGWMNPREIATAFKKSHEMVTTHANRYREKHPDWFFNMSQTSRGIYVLYSPELVNTLLSEFSKFALPPKGWLNTGQLTKAGKNPTIIKNTINKYRQNHPKWFGTFLRQTNEPGEFLSPDLIELINKEIETYSIKLPPEGWMTISTIARTVGKNTRTIKRMVEKLRGSHPEWFAIYMVVKNGQATEHYSPELTTILKENIQS